VLGVRLGNPKDRIHPLTLQAALAPLIQNYKLSPGNGGLASQHPPQDTIVIATVIATMNGTVIIGAPSAYRGNP